MFYFIFIESNKLIISFNSNFEAYAQQVQTIFCSTNTTIANHHKHREQGNAAEGGASTLSCARCVLFL
jgi:hypothetical protein